MRAYKITIELLSDMCVSDGGVYNSVVDIDICKDQYGFPYIPGKRLKGCLRESALELVEWGENISIDKLFGVEDEHSNQGGIRISDARLEDYSTYAGMIDEKHPIFHRQNVLSLYSYTRTQTAINRESGAADENSLRTMRVANKGLKFVSRVNVSEKLIEECGDIFNAMDMICTNLMHIGNSRTRGMGEIAVSFSEVVAAEIGVNNSTFDDDSDMLEYEIYLNEPIVCKSIAGGEAVTTDYIEGSKILGVVANRFREQFGGEIAEILDSGKLIFSNAYIADKGVRYTEVPAYIYSIKNNKESYVNKLYDSSNTASEKNGEKRQLNQMKHIYTCIDNSGALTKLSVENEKRYHHRRPEDKSIGRAVKENGGNSNFYQISSIASGQSFKGIIKGNSEQLRLVYDLLNKQATCRIGYGSSSEYGKVTIRSLKGYKSPVDTIKTDSVVVTLNSPTIIYNDKAMYASEIADLVEEIKAEIGVTECSIEQKYVKYVQVGGYNITWNMRKPYIQAFDKGTSVVLNFGQPVEIRRSELDFIGERITEGYGEYSISAFNANGCVENIIVGNENITTKIDKINLEENVLAKRICNNLFVLYVNNKSIDKARIFKADSRPTVSNLMLMCEENDTIDGVRDAIKKRYEEKTSATKQEKNEIANKIISCVDELAENIITDFEKHYSVTNFKYDADVKLLILKSLLQSIKYVIKSNEMSKGAR